MLLFAAAARERNQPSQYEMHDGPSLNSMQRASRHRRLSGTFSPVNVAAHLQREPAVSVPLWQTQQNVDSFPADGSLGLELPELWLAEPLSLSPSLPSGS